MTTVWGRVIGEKMLANDELEVGGLRLEEQSWRLGGSALRNKICARYA